MIITEGEKPAFLPAPWTAASALCRLVERTNRDVLRSQAMRLFVANSPLELALRPQPASDETLSALEDTLSRWRASERFLFPILAFFDTLGLGELAAEIRAQRSEATNAFLRTPGAEAGHYDGVFLTRPTYTQLEQERDRLAWELKTTVAQAIGRAREMGDLSENAEYDAAKDKQAKHVNRIGAINDQLRKATLIGSIEVPAGQVGPGSWVTLRRVTGPGAETRTFWLLGEGDSRFGPEVVSCSAPTGRAMLGRKVGEEIEIELTEENCARRSPRPWCVCPRASRPPDRRDDGRRPLRFRRNAGRHLRGHRRGRAGDARLPRRATAARRGSPPPHRLGHAGARRAVPPATRCASPRPSAARGRAVATPGTQPRAGDCALSNRLRGDARAPRARLPEHGRTLPRTRRRRDLACGGEQQDRGFHARDPRRPSGSPIPSGSWWAGTRSPRTSPTRRRSPTRRAAWGCP